LYQTARQKETTSYSAVKISSSQFTYASAVLEVVMRNCCTLLLLLGLIALALAGAYTEAQIQADLVLKNATIYTADAVRRWAQALAVRDGRLVYVGTDEGVRELIGPRTRLIDLNGRLVLPGFHDSHAHPIAAGIQRSQCDLTKAHSIEEVLARVKAYAEANLQKPWILGFGWNPSLFPEGKQHKRLLDSVVSNRPVLLTAAGGGQSIWVNSRALALSGVTDATPEPKNGRIERDQATGEPTGVFRGTARGLISSYVPAPTTQEYREALQYALKEFARLGIVSFEDAYATSASLAAYTAAQREGTLTARVRAALPFQAELDPGKDDEQVRRLLEARRIHQSEQKSIQGEQDRRFRADVVKIHLDGTIDVRTAALLDAYQPLGKQRGGPGFAGLPRYDAGRLYQLAMRLDREGFQMHLHAVGDRAVRMALDALAQACKANGIRDSRHIITHLHLVHPLDAHRFQQLGVVANFQPVMASANDYNSKLVEPLVGPQRSQRLYPIRSMMDSGAIVTAGSDWPDSSLNPLEGIEVALTRQAAETANLSAWIPEQRVDLTRMIAAYTIAGAYQSFTDRDSGSLEVGKWADFIVLDRNLFAIPVREIHRTKVLWTVLEGEEVFRAGDWN
jgi:predicted amidohydrolase YtcJ